MLVSSVIIHDLRSMHNVGSILRSCDGFGVQTVYIGGTSPYPRISGDSRLPHLIDKQTKDIAKTALGAESTLDIIHYEDIMELIIKLRETTEVVALEQSSRSIQLAAFTCDKPVALLLGREVEGVDPTLLDLVDQIVEIPMRGSKESFNVSVAAGIALYALSLAPKAP